MMPLIIASHYFQRRHFADAAIRHISMSRFSIFHAFQFTLRYSSSPSLLAIFRRLTDYARFCYSDTGMRREWRCCRLALRFFFAMLHARRSFSFH
jgi:hypothetical protein